MALLLNLLLLFFFVVFIVVGMTAWRIYRSFRNVADRVRSAAGGGSYTRKERRSDSQNGRTYTRTDEKITIIDTRSPEIVGRKIFEKTEGEYVSFTTIKD